MNRCNPLVVEALRGLCESGPAHLAYLNYLAIQAVVLFIWWPKNAVFRVLETEDGPDTLLAVVIALGVTVAYYNIRAGAEEILLTGQHPLREWVLATPLTLSRILRGYLLGHLLQNVQLIALSSPLLLAAFWVAAGEWAALGWSLVAVLMQATFYRLAAAVVYTTIGQHEAVTLFSIRAILVAGYAVAAALLPSASHLIVSFRLLNASPVRPLDPVIPSHVVFILVYATFSIVLVAVLYVLLSRQRRMRGDPLAPAGVVEAKVDTGL